MLFSTALLPPMMRGKNVYCRSNASPNIILVFIDDMGWGDLSCYGNTKASTPHIDQMAEEGLRFEQFYVNSPICSPSRTAISTGQYPQRYRITSYLNSRKSNQERGVADWLDPNAPMLARFLKEAGYATGHFGKWHMGGQRNVNDAPPISDYGFDESLTNFEGMGAKLLPLIETPTEDGGVKQGRIWEQAEILGEPFEWMLRSKITSGFVNRAVDFIDRAQAEGKPFYINLWPDDVHSPYYPSIQNWADSKSGLYRAVLEEMDRQLGVLFDKIRNEPVLREKTLILICSDNGPEKGAGTAGPFRGYKTMLYEGGVRSPLIVWGEGFINKNQNGSINNASVFSAIDLVPSLLEIANIPIPETVEFDGESLSQTLIGKSNQSRSKPIFFRRPPDRKSFYGVDNLPDLAVREGKWKFLCDFDGTRSELYDLDNDPSETKNLVGEYPSVSNRLKQAVLDWNETIQGASG
ncbi:MAG: sulfatase-like hydrolase/transferase [Candidatus Omnitrophica bacterium]|nr:sulfatase-like hydrolase/transferase [Candidatus Omnitrophota bacterium]